MSGESSNDPRSGFEKIQPPLDRVRQEMERWLEVARTTGERALETLGVVTSGRSSAPNIDIVELDSEVIVLAELPGVAAENVQVSLTGNMLTLKGTRQGFAVPETGRRHVCERTATQYERTIPLPVPVDPEGVRAETRDGLLTITLRKPVAMPGRSIPVSRANSGSRPDLP